MADMDQNGRGTRVADTYGDPANGGGARMTTALGAIQATARRVARDVAMPLALTIDRDGRWPAESMKALGEAGLLGLHLPTQLGGRDEGLLALALVTEELGKACSSTAMCFGMHSVAAKVITARATPDQVERFLRPIAEGRHVTSLALSEPGTGAHFFLPRAQMRRENEQFLVTGQKSFVTSGGHADSYVVSAVPPGHELDPGAFSCLVMEGDAAGLDWADEWDGFGMRGNSSRAVTLRDVAVPVDNLLGAEGDQIWYVFEVVAPYFITAMAGVYLGIAQAAFDFAAADLKARRHQHTGETLDENPVLADQVAGMWIALESTRQLVHHAARKADAGDADATQALFASKAAVANTATSVTQAALELCGGRGYGANGTIARLIRDAQAAHVMSPTTHLVRQWLGRSLLGLSPF